MIDPLDVTPSWWRKAGRPTVAEFESAVSGLLGQGVRLLVASDERVLVARPWGSHPALVDNALKGAVKPKAGEPMQLKAHKHRRQRIDVTPSWFGTEECTSADVASAVRRLIDTGAVKSVCVFEHGITVVAALASFTVDRQRLCAVAEGEGLS